MVRVVDHNEGRIASDALEKLDRAERLERARRTDEALETLAGLRSRFSALSADGEAAIEARRAWSELQAQVMREIGLSPTPAPVARVRVSPEDVEAGRVTVGWAGMAPGTYLVCGPESEEDR